MKLSKLPKRTRSRIYKLATLHLLDVDQVIGIAVDVLFAALEGGPIIPMPAAKAKPRPRPATDTPQAVGDVINAALQGSTRPHRDRQGR